VKSRSADARRVAPSRTDPSRAKAAEDTEIGASNALSPRISRMLAVFEPTTLPAAIAGLPLRAAETEVVNSGMEVPKPTTTKPIRSGDTLAA
jgi:hypothetical protein